MSKTKLKSKKDSLILLTQKYSHDPMACVEFFFNIKWPTGFFCEKCNCTHYYTLNRGYVFECSNCGHQYYLFSGTIFENNKLSLYKLIIALYMFFTANKGLSAIEMASQLDVNYKTALKLCKKCRILMSLSNSEKILDNIFYEADTAYIGSKKDSKPGMSTEQQPFLAVLSTDKEGKYPKFIKLCFIPKDNSHYMNHFIEKKCKLSMDRTLNTDGKSTFFDLGNKITLKSEKILYDDKNHRLKWLNIIIGNVKNNITGIYHGVPKRVLPLFLNEQEWRFNHRKSGNHIMEKISKYIRISFKVSDETIKYILDISEPYFSNTCD